MPLMQINVDFHVYINIYEILYRGRKIRENVFLNWQFLFKMNMAHYLVCKWKFILNNRKTNWTSERWETKNRLNEVKKRNKTIWSQATIINKFISKIEILKSVFFWECGLKLELYCKMRKKVKDFCLFDY